MPIFQNGKKIKDKIQSQNIIIISGKNAKIFL